MLDKLMEIIEVTIKIKSCQTTDFSDFNKFAALEACYLAKQDGRSANDALVAILTYWRITHVKN